MTPNCPACAAELALGQRFCLNCGARLPGASPDELLALRAAGPESPPHGRLRLPSPTSASATLAATLAAGMLVGVGVGPVLDGTSNANQRVLVALPQEPDPPGAEPLTAGPGDLTGALGAPVGNVEAPPAPTAPAPAAPPAPAPEPEPEPAEEYVPPLEGDDEPAEEDEPAVETYDIDGAVVQTSEFADSYAVATDSGEVLPVHAASLPELGASVDTTAVRLANGTFAEDERTEAAPVTAATLRGVITWTEPESGLYTLSVRGASILIGRDPELDPLAVGTFAKAGVAIEEPPAEDEPFRPRLREQTLVVEGEPFPEQTLEVSTVVWRVDPELREVALSVDGAGEAEQEMLVAVEAGLDLEALEAEQALIATLTPREGEPPLLTGWADDSGRKAADDPDLAHGNQAS